MGKWYHPVLGAKADKNLISHVINLKLPCMITLTCSVFSQLPKISRNSSSAMSSSQIVSARAELQNLGSKLFTLGYGLDIVLFQ